MNEYTIETTTIWNKELRTFEPVKQFFKCGADAFNALSPIPPEGPPEYYNSEVSGNIKIGIIDWNPFGDVKTTSNFLRIEIKAGLSLAEGSKFPSDANSIVRRYNIMVKSPGGPIFLNGGRLLYINKWSPSHEDEGTTEFVHTTIEGFIRFDRAGLEETLRKLYPAGFDVEESDA